MRTGLGLRLTCLAGIALVVAGCSKSSSGTSSDRAGAASGAGSIPAKVAVAGTIAIDPSVQGVAAQTNPSGRTVALADDSGTVVASAATTTAGAFTVELDTSAVGLLDAPDSATGPIVLTMSSLFLADGTAAPTALGVKRTLALDPSSATFGADGSATIQTGTHKAATVGAIVGKIALATGADATGTDVYVPGTENIAKTDATGRFLLGFLPAGPYTIRADRDGYGSIEWDDVEVKQNTTTALADATMQISTGPKIAEFALDSGTAVALSATINLKLKLPGATKFRVSQLADFRDATYRPVDATVDEMTVPFSISGPDGPVSIFLEAADAGGLTADQTLSLILDTTAPVAPAFTVRSGAAQAGYTNTTTPNLFVTACGAAAQLFLTEDAAAAPTADQFTVKCADAAGASGAAVKVSAGDGAKTLYLWALDAGGRISTAASQGSVTLISTAPVLTVTPPAGAYNAAIPVTAAAGALANIYYTTDLATPTADSSKVNGTLVLNNGATLKFLAIDFAGNQSAVAEAVYTIDTEAPILGSVAANVTNGYWNVQDVPLTLSAVGATYMAFGETSAALSTPTWIPYSTTTTYTLQNTAEGLKTIYAEFKDDAGNLLGAQGTISTTFTYKTTAPQSSLIVLLAPDTPSSDFDKILLWTASFSETVSYVVQVSEDANFSALAAAGTSTTTSWQITPTLTDSTTYYWRVAAVDLAGNQSDWVSSGTAKDFTLGVLSTDFQSRRDHNGAMTLGQSGPAAGANVMMSDQFYGWDVAMLSDLNGDGQQESAVSIYLAAPNPNNPCGGLPCGAVKVLDVAGKAELATVYDPNVTAAPGGAAGGGYPAGGNPDLFGLRVVGCNLDGNGAHQDQIVVSAPGLGYNTTAPSYQLYANQGAVYAYAYANHALTLKGSYVRQAPDGTTPYNGGCTSCSYSFSGTPLPDPPVAAMGGGPYAGWAIACERRDSGGDYLLVSEPGYNSSGNFGRVVEMQLSGTALVPTGVEFDAPAAGDTGFALAVAYLPNFQDSACNSAAAGKTIAIGAPRGSNPSYNGAVYLYGQNGSGAWVTTPCNTIQAQASDPVGIGFGFSLADIGSPDAASASDKLAVGAPGLTCSNQGGIVRIYGNGGGTTALKSILPESFNGAAPAAPAWGTQCGAGYGAAGALGGDAYSRFGYTVAAAGDFNADGATEIAVGAPGAAVNGNPNAGAVYLYTWSGLQTGDSGTSPTVYKTVTGAPLQGDDFGARYVTVPSSGGSVDDAINYALITRPNHTPPNPTAGGAAAPGCCAAGPGSGVGQVQEYAVVKMKISTPFSLTGSDTNEGFGRSLVALPDINGDGISDLLVGRPGGRCNGLTWGAATLVSGYDSIAFHSICGEAYGSEIGEEALFFPQLGPDAAPSVVLSQVESGDANLDLISIPAIGVPPSPMVATNLLNALVPNPPSGALPDNFTQITLKASGASLSDAKALPPAPITADYFAIGQPDYGGGPTSGIAQLIPYAPKNPNVDQPQIPACSVTGNGSGTLFGTGVGVAIAMVSNGGGPTPPPPTPAPTLLVGSPGMKTLSNNNTGTVFAMVVQNPPDCPPPVGQATTSTAKMLRIDADDAKIKAANGGNVAASGFGSYLLGLPQLATDHDLYFLMANTNIRAADSDQTPEYYVIGVTLGNGIGASASYDVVWYESGTSGSMLGGYAKIIGNKTRNLSGDAVCDVAVAAPSGPGRYGNTGQVRVLSCNTLGAIGTYLVANPAAKWSDALTTTGSPLVQVIFNPDDGTSHFGVAMDYADMNGDGIPDMIIGADRYSLGGIADAGAVYIFPVEPVQQ